MKITGFKEHKITPYVRGMDYQSFEVSMEFVINSGVHNFEILENGERYISIEHQVPCRIENAYSNRCRIAHLSAKCGGRKKKIFGFYVYNSAMGFVDFLVNKYIPSGKTTLDKFLRKDIDETKAMEQLYKMLFDDVGHPIDQAFYYSTPALSTHIFRNGITMLECNDRWGVYFLQKVERHLFSCRIFYIEDEFKMGDFQVPIRRFFIFSGWEHPIFYWDENKMDHFFASGIGGLKQKLGSDIWEEFEERAACESYTAYAQWFIPSQFKATHLIRVPSIEEARPLLNKKVKSKASPRGCGKPMYLFDTRASIRLTKDITTIMEAKDALRILSKTIDGTYVSNDVSTDPMPMLKNEVYYLVGVIPDEWQY